MNLGRRARRPAATIDLRVAPRRRAPLAGDVRAEPAKPRGRKHQPVDLPGTPLRESRVDVAAQGEHLDVGAGMSHEGTPAQARGAQACTARQPAQAAGAMRDQHVARILPPWHGRDAEPGCKGGRKILHRVHGEVDRSRKQRFFDLLDEQPLAADLGERAALDAVAAGADVHELDGQAGRLCAQRSRHPLGLAHGEDTAARTEAQDPAALTHRRRGRRAAGPPAPLRRRRSPLASTA